MTSEEKKEFIKNMKAFTEEVSKDPEKTKAFLQKTGIYTKSCNLRKAYK